MEISCFHVFRRIFWIFALISPSRLQPSPPPLSLPVQVSVVPPVWTSFPVFQEVLTPLFSNSSPFSSSQSLLLLPPLSPAPPPSIQASFGPFSVSELVSESVVPPSLLVSASLLSDSVERGWDEEGNRSFTVRVLFHKRGNISGQQSCISLHAFKDTEEQRASCIPQPPLGVCVVALTLPNGWFEAQQTEHPHQGPDRRNTNPRLKRYRGNLNRRPAASSSSAAAWSLRFHQNHIQMFYSSVEQHTSSARCEEDRAFRSQSRLFFIRTVSLDDGRKQSGSRMQEVCVNRQEGEELRVDSHVVIGYHRGPVLVGQPIRVSVKLRANFSAQFVVISLRVRRGLVSVVARRTLTSDLWTVTLERSQSSEHDVVSIVCHKHSDPKPSADSSALQQVVCLSVDGLRRSFGVAMTVSADWWVEYSGRSNPPSKHRTATSFFSFTDRHVYGIAPITQSNSIINTAILTNQPVSLPVLVLAVGDHHKLSDVTSAVTCSSSNENTVKVSRDCSSLFVDGSESGLGNTCAQVEFVLGMLSGSVCVQVWAPTVPVQVFLSDPVLNAIDGWNVVTEDGCSPVYQRSSLQVLTQFRALDSSSRSVHLLGSSDLFVDVTELVRDWLRVEDPRVAALGPRSSVIGLRPGRTSVHVISELWDGVLGRCDVIVSPDTVAPGDLHVQVVGGLGVSVTAGSAHPSIVTATVTASNILHQQQQEASISVWLQFDDDTASLLSTFSDLPFVLHLSSLADSVVAVAPGPAPRVLAQGDGGGPLLRAELLVSSCADPTSGSAHGSAHRRTLAGGSGWIRVNLDLDWKQAGPKKDEFELKVSERLVEAFSNMFTSGENLSYDDERIGQRSRTEEEGLERAVLTPHLEDVFSSPSQEKEKDGGTEDGDGAQDLELGVGAVLSLLLLSAALCLANCLPCILRDRRARRTEQDRDAKRGRGSTEDEGGEEKTLGDEWEDGEMKTGGVEDEQDGIHKEDVKQAEMICC